MANKPSPSRQHKHLAVLLINASKGVGEHFVPPKTTDTKLIHNELNIIA